MTNDPEESVAYKYFERFQQLAEIEALATSQSLKMNTWSLSRRAHFSRLVRRESE